MRRAYADDGPSKARRLFNSPRGVAPDVLKFGDVIEVCGYVPSERPIRQIASTSPTLSDCLDG